MSNRNIVGMNSSSNNFRSNQFRGKSNNQSFPLKYVIVALSCLVFVGIFFCAYMAPSEFLNGPGTNSLIGFSSSKSLSERILDWLPQHHHMDLFHDGSEAKPDWTVKFWTPIDVDVSSGDSMIVLCKLNFKKYWESPHSYPMFRDLEGMSQCTGKNRRRELLSVLLKEIEDEKQTVVPPTGFVFHESRVGSTLVANFLASDPWSLVFSESTPIANAILHCSSCSLETQISLFKGVVTLMGRSPIHKRLFFKFQSITCTKMEIALQAFPSTPWAFLFRSPVQTMMSHLDPRKGQNAAPCLRSKRSPPPQVSDVISKHVTTGRASNEAWCAAHLNMLCQFALDSYEKYGTWTDVTSGEKKQRGWLLNYDSLPGSIPNVLLPLFGVEHISKSWLDKITVESKQYSKSRGSSYRLFFGDSQDKDERATENIRLYANEILNPTFEVLNQKSKEAIQLFKPDLFNLITEAGPGIIDWKKISDIPTYSEEVLKTSSSISREKEEEDEEVIKHSHYAKQKEFIPWIPFANHHSSKPKEIVNCPLIPEVGYPKPYSMIDITNNWNTDSTEIPPFHFDSLCHFDFQNQTQLKQAHVYRDLEVPFVVYNIPQVDEVVKKWNNMDYLGKTLGKKFYRTESSIDNHFMYWRNAPASFLRSVKGKDWKPPTDIVSLQFEQWLEIAVKGQNISLENRDHKYFRVSSDMGNPWLFNELPFFKPVKSLFLVEPREQRGIHCRFGMRSVIAEAHFDGSRNSVVMLGGLRRWILTHPDQCVNMHMLPANHPSGRHSEVDWSKPDIEKFPNFAKLMGNEVILQPGDFLYVPTYWIHYIISLNINFQCNTRSGTHSGYDNYIRTCGF